MTALSELAAQVPDAVNRLAGIARRTPVHLDERLSTATGAQTLTLSLDGDFQFTGELTDGAAYSVTVQTQPTAPIESCSVTNGSGTATADVTDIQVKCSDVIFKNGFEN